MSIQHLIYVSGANAARGAIVAISLLVIVASLQGFNLPGNREGYEPVQPIEYSHRLHAGELRIACLYCHYGAEKSRNAGIPATGVCMNCHSAIQAPAGAIREEQERAAAEKRTARPVVSPGIQRLYDAMGLDSSLNPDPSRGPHRIEWTRVHRLPDFVYFDHRSHVNTGVRCQTCHGPVETMQRVRQVSDLSMGWCVDCHREANRNGTDGRRVHATLDCAGCHF